MTPESRLETDLTELKDLSLDLVRDGRVKPGTNIYNRVVQEYDLGDEVHVTRVAPQYSLDEGERETLAKAPHANVPIDVVPDIIDGALADEPWLETAPVTDRVHDAGYSWYDIDYATIDGETFGYLAANFRVKDASSELPYSIRQDVSKVHLGYDETAPEIGRDLWSIYESRPSVENVVTRFRRVLEGVSPDATLGVSTDGNLEIREPESALLLEEDADVIDCIDLGLGEPTVAQLRDTLEKVENDDTYEEFRRRANDRGFQKHSLSYGLRDDEFLRFTVEAARLRDDVYSAVARSNVPFP